MRQKRYCPRCQERIRHSAARCHYCGALALSARHLLAALLLASLLLLLLWWLRN
jgi:predicted amidophosphoribosyltransferase